MNINKAYFKVSDKEVLRAMVALYGFEAVQSALYEVSRPTPRAVDLKPAAVVKVKRIVASNH